MRARLVICDQCHQAARIVNGVHQTMLELRNINDAACVIPHAPTCPTLED